MHKYQISINDLPPEGREYTLNDPDIWALPLQEFQMDCRVTRPLEAKIHVLLSGEGCLLRGRLTGQVVLPCNRCTEDAVVDIDSTIEDFEELPQAEEMDEQALAALEDAEPYARISFEKHVPLLDLAAVCWEEFMLALPVNPLCREDCKGLCPRCGTNLNTGSCSCIPDEGDPRLAVLRGLTLHKP